METHIAHATATFAELSLAMSIAMISKIIKTPLIIDTLARETASNRIDTSETWFIKLVYRIACYISDSVRGFFSYSAWLSFVMAVFSLFGLAFCPDATSKTATWVFVVSFLSFLIICIYVYSARELLIKTGEAPAVEPVP